jgi:predicted RNA-binding Zn-ribbon protein involved in translation (DUF1610 family)
MNKNKKKKCPECQTPLSKGEKYYFCPNCGYTLVFK